MYISELLLLLIVLPVVSAVLGFIIGKKNEKKRNTFYIITTFVNLCIVIYLFKFIKNNTIQYYMPNLFGMGVYLKMNVFRYIFVFITSFIWFIVTIYSSQYLINYHNRNRYYLFFMITYACTLGVFMSDNLLSLFTFFEMMSFASYPLIIHDEDRNAHDASSTYILMTTISGLVLLMGIFIGYSYTKTLDIPQMGNSLAFSGNIKYLVGILMIIGFGVKAGIVPLHIWLPKAHPAAPTPASAVLSGILVKTGVFGIMMVYGFILKFDYYFSILLVICGFINMLFGGWNALFHTNIKKILAYSSISQIGYMLLGIGCIGLLKGHEEIALFGALFRIVNHAIFKTMLFMGVGIIYMITHSLDINTLRGFGRFKPILKITFFAGFCAIIGIPGFNGFIDKTMIHHAFIEASHYSGLSWLMFCDVIYYITGALTTAYLIKLYLALFVENNSRYYADYKKHINLRALFPMVCSAFLIVFLGLFPNFFLNNITGVSEILGLKQVSSYTVNYFTSDNILSSLFTISLGILIYKFYILKKLTFKNEKGERIFINTKIDSFSIEKRIYIPMFEFIFKYSTFMLHYIDKTMYWLYVLISRSDKVSENLKARDDRITFKIKTTYASIYLPNDKKVALNK